MPFPPLKIARICALVLLLSAPVTLRAQANVWGGVGTAQKTATGKTAAGKNKLKEYKDHLQKWGMDTSYKHAFLIGGKLNSNGWSGCMDFIHKKKYTSHIWQISFSEIKHDKQTKQTGTNNSYPELGNPTPYVFGKINNLYTLQVGYGEERLLLPSVMEGNISVSYRYNAGFSLAMLKPYYLKLMEVDTSAGQPQERLVQATYNEADSAQFLNPNFILGAATWSKGIANTTFVPGAYFETAIAITPGKNKAFIQVITLGINASLYTQALPIMQGQQASPWQVCLFAGLGVGKKWK